MLIKFPTIWADKESDYVYISPLHVVAVYSDEDGSTIISTDAGSRYPVATAIDMTVRKINDALEDM